MSKPSCVFDHIGRCSLDGETGKKMSYEDTIDNDGPCGFYDQTQCTDAAFPGTLPEKFATPEKKLMRLKKSRDILKSHVDELNEKIALIEHQLSMDHPGWQATEPPKHILKFDPETQWPRKL